MGGRSSKKPFTEWDLIQFSNVTGVPLSTVQKIYQDFIARTGNENRMDKKEFRNLYKEMFMNSQTGSNVAPFFTEHDLDKMSDHVFETYDFDGSEKLTFEEFAEIYLMLSHYSGTSASGAIHRDRFNYILDQDSPTTPGFITRSHGEQVLNRLNRYTDWVNSKTTTPANTSQPATTSVEHHWNKLDDGSGRVPKDKFVDYVTTSNDYKPNFDPAAV